METKGGILKLAVPMETLRKSNGFALDMGGSLIKLVYLDKEEWENHGGVIDEKTGRGTLYVTSFPRENVDEVLAFIRENVYIRRSPDPTPVIHTTGVGLNTLADRFNSYLNLRCENTFEFDDFILSAKYFLENFEYSDVLETLPEHPFFESPKTRHGRSMEDKPNFAEPLSERPEVVQGTGKYQYPILLCQMGSGFAFFRVYEDRSYDYLDITPLAGRSFLDLGRFLTGAKTFEELAALAEAGNEDNLYARVAPMEGNTSTGGPRMDMFGYSFGNAHGKDIEDLSKADIARTLLQTICSNVMNTAHHLMVQENVQHLFLVGSFVQPDLMRRLLVKEFEVLRGLHVSRSSTEHKLHIFTLSGCMGALGSFLTGCDVTSKNVQS